MRRAVCLQYHSPTYTQLLAGVTLVNRATISLTLGGVYELALSITVLHVRRLESRELGDIKHNILSVRLRSLLREQRERPVEVLAVLPIVIQGDVEPGLISVRDPII